jgi:hypothetical protein
MDLLGWLVNPLIRLLVRPFTRLDHRLQDWWRARGTDNWIHASGELQSRTLDSQAGGIWRVTMFYTFPADGKWWPGNMWRQFAIRKDAQRYVDSHPPGATIRVRYQPGEPGKSVALSRDQHLASPEGTI